MIDAERSNRAIESPPHSVSQQTPLAEFRIQRHQA
jgi:hypothetical protein